MKEIKNKNMYKIIRIINKKANNNDRYKHYNYS